MWISKPNLITLVYSSLDFIILLYNAELWKRLTYNWPKKKEETLCKLMIRKTENIIYVESKEKSPAYAPNMCLWKNVWNGYIKKLMLTLYYTNLEFNLNSKLAKKLEKILLIRLYVFRYTYPKILKNKTLFSPLINLSVNSFTFHLVLVNI